MSSRGRQRKQTTQEKARLREEAVNTRGTALCLRHFVLALLLLAG